MQIIFEQKNRNSPRLSIVLLDWSCRESFHILDYLNKQTIPREQYEIIWIEYYSRRSDEVEAKIRNSEKSGTLPAVDKWIIMEMPPGTCYHKHLMYNIGIIASVGKITTICDSDAIVEPTFVESIIKTFEQNSDIVLHLDEFRNTDRRFYPFNYPSTDEITGKGCINFKNGKTTGLLDEIDQIHTRNYGACMCALKQDLISVGGADEHQDYFGHICGPYDMTFRLVNYGKREIWHQTEFLYHTWHPGMDGIGNYLGPHDGFNMSTVALKVRNSLRILPLVENTAIKIIRTDSESVLYDSLLSQAVPMIEILRWKPKAVKRNLKQTLIRYVDVYRKFRNNPEHVFRSIETNIKLCCVVFLLILRQIFSKLVRRTRTKNSVMKKGIFLDIRLFFIFFLRMLKNNIYTVKLCRQTLKKLAAGGIKEVALYGTDFVTKILCVIAKQIPLKITGIYGIDKTGDEFLRHRVPGYQSLAGFEGKVIIATLTRGLESALELKEIGIKDKNIIKLQ